VRALTPAETQVIRWFAVRVGESARRRLLEDLADTMVEETRDEHVTLRFYISGRSPLGFEDTYPASFASALDADGGNLVLALWLDLDGTLYELHVSRVATGPVQRPDWANLSAMTREEFLPASEIECCSRFGCVACAPVATLPNRPLHLTAPGRARARPSRAVLSLTRACLSGMALEASESTDGASDSLSHVWSRLRCFLRGSQAHRTICCCRA